jgi:hypothetical protein
MLGIRVRMIQLITDGSDPTNDDTGDPQTDGSTDPTENSDGDTGYYHTDPSS